jgi:hypothetical protein
VRRNTSAAFVAMLKKRRSPNIRKFKHAALGATHYFSLATRPNFKIHGLLPILFFGGLTTHCFLIFWLVGLHISRPKHDGSMFTEGATLVSRQPCNIGHPLEQTALHTAKPLGGHRPPVWARLLQTSELTLHCDTVHLRDLIYKTSVPSVGRIAALRAAMRTTYWPLDGSI